MTDLPAAQRDELVAALLPTLMTPLRTLEADKGTTRKTLWRLFDGALVESVLMRYPDRVTMCVSSPGRLRDGLPVLRHRPGRPAAQHVHRRDRRAGRRRRPVAGPRRGARRSRPGLQRGVHGHGRAAGQLQGRDRRRTPAHRPGARRPRHVAPAASPCRRSGWCRGSTSSPTRASRSRWRCRLHAPDDELRNELVPINTRWSVAETVEAAWNYARVTKRRVSIEYAMMRGINDQAWRADLLGRRAARPYGDWGWVHVNLIPLNPTPGSKWTASDPADEREFVRRLEAKGIPTTVRDTRGREIDGACGQLAAERVARGCRRPPGCRGPFTRRLRGGAPPLRRPS